jgi:hypothetical protein
MGRSFFESITNFWNSLRAKWNGIYQSVKSTVARIFRRFEEFVKQVVNFGIGAIIRAINIAGAAIKLLVKVAQDPNIILEPLGKMIMMALFGVPTMMLRMVAKYIGPPAQSADPAARNTASWSDIGTNVFDLMVKKWEHIMANPGEIVTSLLLDLLFPVYGNIKDSIKLVDDIKAILREPFKSDSIDEFWANLLKVLDIATLISNYFIGVIMRSTGLILIIAAFIPPLAPFAHVIGLALLGAFAAGQTSEIVNNLIILKKILTNQEEKNRRYNRISDSITALAITAAMMALIWLASKVASAIQGLLKVKTLPVVETKAGTSKPNQGKVVEKGRTTPPEGERPPVVEEEGNPRVTEGESLRPGQKEVPSRDGQRRIRMKDGVCEVCASPCKGIRERHNVKDGSPADFELKRLTDGFDQLSPEQQSHRMQQLADVEQRIKNGELATESLSLPERTSEQLDDLARDPAHGNEIGPKGIHERKIGLELEAKGKLKSSIRRDPSGAAEFIDGSETKWDIKSFDSRFPKKKGGFSLERDMGKIEAELNAGENVILDSTNLSPEHLIQLKEAVTSKGWSDRILWYP